MKEMRNILPMMIATMIGAGLAGGQVPPAVSNDEPARSFAGMEKGAYLGVATQPVGDTLGRQLKLPRGVGLIVMHVEPGSPASTVLREHDVLQKLNDQFLVDHRQLAVLVRMQKPGDKVNLTRVRDGVSENVGVSLVEKDLPPLSSGSWDAPPLRLDPPLMFPMGPGGSGSSIDRLRELLEGSGMGAEKMRDIVEQMEESMKGLSGMGRRGMDSQVRMRLSDPSGAHTTTSISDGITLTVSQDVGGRRELVAVDAGGKELFRGPINTPEEREKVPPEIRKKLDELEQTRKGLLQEKRMDPKRKESKSGESLTL